MWKAGQDLLLRKFQEGNNFKIIWACDNHWSEMDMVYSGIMFLSLQKDFASSQKTSSPDFSFLIDSFNVYASNLTTFMAE